MPVVFFVWRSAVRTAGHFFALFFRVPQNQPYCQRLLARFCPCVGGFGSRFSPTAGSSPRLGSFAGFWRGFRRVGCQHPAAFSDASLAAFRAEIGPADFDAGESGVSFAGLHRAHISPQCGLNGVFGVFHFRLILASFLCYCFFSGIYACFSTNPRSLGLFHFLYFPGFVTSPLFPSYCQHLSRVLVF